MNLKNKNGFITVYVMLAMIFLISFVTVSLVTVARRQRMQNQTNELIIQIYKPETNDLDNTSKEIPIYTKEQFVELIEWVTKCQTVDR